MRSAKWPANVFGDIGGPYIILTLTVRQTRIGDGIGVYNLGFTQANAPAPEPASLKLLAIGGVGLSGPFSSDDRVFS